MRAHGLEAVGIAGAVRGIKVIPYRNPTEAELFDALPEPYQLFHARVLQPGMDAEGRHSDGHYDPGMTRARVSPDVEIEYEDFGDVGHPAVLLVAGWGSQLITWHDDFRDELLRRGYRVVRFDNRDVGLSTKIESGDAYSLSDMAADAVGLLDAVGIERAHIMGASMGGMIAQTIAIEHPARVLTLTSIMSTTGAPGVGQAEPGLVAAMQPAGETRDERIEASIASSRAIWNDTVQFPFDEELARSRAEVSIDRSYYPVGRLRQALAIRASGDRTAALRDLDVPTLVIHGDRDPLINVSGGEATVAAIPGAELVVIGGMGHLVARPAWTRMLDAFDALALRARTQSESHTH
jgi:pimeloyl-ACP methyl ester carboxylesterase